MMDSSGGFKVPSLNLAAKKRSKTEVKKPDSPEKTSHSPVSTDSAPLTEEPQHELDTSKSTSAPTSIEHSETPSTQSTAIEVSNASVASSSEEASSTDSQEDVSDSKRQQSVADKGTKESQLKQVAPPISLPYTEPHWSGALPSSPYLLSVIKNGTIIQEIDISKKPFHVFGRLPSCDIPLEHPSISRYHAVIQYRPQSTQEETSEDKDTESRLVLSSALPTEEGFYVYDLGSTHGSFVNKNELRPRCYYRLRVGQMVKFGGSSRLFLLECRSGGQDEVEADAEAEIQEIVRQKEELERKRAAAKAEQERLAREREEAGASWGMVFEEPSSMEETMEEYHIDEEREAYYKEDPKKALKKFFDREGLELEYEAEEEESGRTKVYTVRVRLPIETAAGSAVYAEASVKGKKKEAVVECALNACRMLDAQDMLRHHVKAHKRKKRNWEENDYYDSDEDTFLDRTGSIEKKRQKRMKKAGALANDQAENYQTLQTKLSETLKEMYLLETKLLRDRQGLHGDMSSNGDSLESYMKTVSDRLDKFKRAEIKHRVHELKKEEERLKKLITMTKPVSLPELSRSDPARHVETTKLPIPANATLESTQTSSMVRGTEPLTTPYDSITGTLSHMYASKERKATKEDDKTQDTAPISDSKHVKAKEVGKTIKTPPHSQSHKGKSRLVGPTRPPSQDVPVQDTAAKSTTWQDDPDYCDWMPPEYQTGDGRTHLNEKFGY